MDFPSSQAKWSYYLSFSACLLFGIWSCWQSCNAPNADAVHYLDIGEAFFQASREHFPNHTWGPLYGIVAVAWLKLWSFSRLPERESLKLLNIVTIFLILQVAGRLFRQVVRDLQLTAQQATGFYLFSFAAILCGIRLLGPARETPDLFLFLVVLTSTLALYRQRNAPAPAYIPCLALGALGAAGYYLKQAYLPVALVFAAAPLWSNGPLLQQFRKALQALAILVVLIGPYLIALSVTAGRPTLGSNGKLNYILDVQKRHVLPPAEFRIPFPVEAYDLKDTYPGTLYPFNYDLAFLERNLPVEVDWRLQLQAAERNFGIVVAFFRQKSSFSFLLAVVAVLIAGLLSRRFALRSIWFPISVAGLLPFVLYPLVHIEFRYLAPYLSLVAIAFWVWSAEAAKTAVLRQLPIACAVVLTALAWDSARDLRVSPDPSLMAFRTSPYEAFTNTLYRNGIASGARIALVGEPLGPHYCAWLRPGKLRLQTFIEHQDEFFRTSPEVRTSLEQELGRRGMQVLLVTTPSIPADQRAEWTPTDLGLSFRRLATP